MPERAKVPLRWAVFLVAAALTSPLWLLARGCKHLLGSEQGFLFGAELLSMVPGLPGVYLRRGYYGLTLESFGIDCQVDFGTTFTRSGVRIGRGVAIGKRCQIGTCDIADGVAIGSNVDLLSGRRHHPVAGDEAPQFRRGRFETIRLGRNCWIGNSAVVMSHVGAGSVIGAGSVVVHEIPPDCVAVGNPAVVKKSLRLRAA